MWTKTTKRPLCGWKILKLRKNRKTGLDHIVSCYDSSPWPEPGIWRKEDPPIYPCRGLNCSRTATGAQGWVAHWPGRPVLALVQYKGEVIYDNGKFTCEAMRLIKVWKINNGIRKLLRKFPWWMSEKKLTAAHKELVRYLADHEPDWKYKPRRKTKTTRKRAGGTKTLTRRRGGE